MMSFYKRCIVLLSLLLNTFRVHVLQAAPIIFKTYTIASEGFRPVTIYPWMYK
jgi:hypothetical protein